MITSSGIGTSPSITRCALPKNRLIRPSGFVNRDESISNVIEASPRFPTIPEKILLNQLGFPSDTHTAGLLRSSTLVTALLGFG